MNALKKFAETSGLSQKEICRLTGFQSGTVSRHITGKRNIEAESAVRYSAALGIPLSSLRPDLPTPCLSPPAEASASEVQQNPTPPSGVL
jgi:transcriptional regulator with XRE-family HTH domain